VRMSAVCVSGGTGFLASHVIRELLAGGYRVHATVRNVDSEKNDYLRQMGTAASGRLHLFEADLLKEGSFDAAMEGCRFLMHLASPYVVDVKDAQKDLVDPAVRGTLNVLESAARCRGLERVVITSSIAAVTDSPEEGRLYDEKDWNTESSLQRNPYHYSKKMAEESAWNFVKIRKPSFTLIVLNPVLVLGPELNPKTVNASTRLLQDGLCGGYPAVFDLSWGFADVRDLAKIHVRAIENPSAEGRYLICPYTIKMKDLVAMLKKDFPGYPLPSIPLNFAAGSFLVKIASYFQPPGIGSYMRTNLGRHMAVDDSKYQRDLKIPLTPLEVTVRDTAEDLIRKGFVPTLKSKL